MIIGIDTSRVTKPYLTGTENYSIEIIRTISKLDKTDDFILYAQKDPGERLGTLGKNFVTKIMPFPRFWSQIRLSAKMLFKKPDVLFVPSHTVPIIHPKKTVVTLHDLGFKHFPKLYSPIEILYHNWGMNFAVKHASKIITPSKFTKDDLIKTYLAEPQKITVIWHGYDPKVFKPGLPEREPFIFFIGRLEEKKNIIGMIKAFALLKKESNIKHKLVLAGKTGFGYEKIKEEIQKLPTPVRNDIVELGYISQEDYLKWLQKSDIFLFTTFFEGFGMPVIEAMAAETPVVASNTTSIPEIAGSAALLVDPYSPLKIASALSRIIHSPALRHSLVSKGRARANLFSWEKAAKKTLEVIKSV